MTFLIPSMADERKLQRINLFPEIKNFTNEVSIIGVFGESGYLRTS